MTGVSFVLVVEILLSVSNHRLCSEYHRPFSAVKVDRVWKWPLIFIWCWGQCVELHHYSPISPWCYILIQHRDKLT